MNKIENVIEEFNVGDRVFLKDNNHWKGAVIEVISSSVVGVIWDGFSTPKSELVSSLSKLK